MEQVNIFFFTSKRSSPIGGAAYGMLRNEMIFRPFLVTLWNPRRVPCRIITMGASSQDLQLPSGTYVTVTKIMNIAAARRNTVTATTLGTEFNMAATQRSICLRVLLPIPIQIWRPTFYSPWRHRLRDAFVCRDHFSNGAGRLLNGFYNSSMKRTWFLDILRLLNFTYKNTATDK